jgi:hypothetical protein
MTYEQVVALIRERGGYSAARTELRRMLGELEGSGVTTEIASLSQGELIARLTDTGVASVKPVKNDEKPVKDSVKEPVKPSSDEQDELPWDAPAKEPAPKPSVKPEAKPAASVKDALATIAAALAEPKAPPVDEKRIIANAVDEAVKAARDAAKGEAANFMRKSVAEFVKDGTVPDEEHAEEDALPPKAVKSGVGEAERAVGWTAKATPQAKDAVGKLTKFLSEFSYFRNGVSMRLVNTFARAEDRKAALRSYCEVSQMEDLPELCEKMESPEFGEVCKAFAPFDEAKPLNNRFSVFYGAPGGGKTYAAIKAGEAINGGRVEVVPCSPSMDAADMLYAYRLDYKTGKRGYVPTALLTAMTAGRAVVLDEVNLLPMEARMFLQNILDNKGEVSVMGVNIPIADGFFVIGTMNLETGLGSTPLPLPLVDRAAVIHEFKATVEQSAVGAGLC